MVGVRISLVRATSNGASRTPAMPAAETDTKRELSGEGDDSMSRPPAEVGPGDAEVKDNPGSGRANRAERKERKKLVRVDKRREWM